MYVEALGEIRADGKTWDGCQWRSRESIAKRNRKRMERYHKTRVHTVRYKKLPLSLVLQSKDIR